MKKKIITFSFTHRQKRKSLEIIIFQSKISTLILIKSPKKIIKYFFFDKKKHQQLKKSYIISKQSTSKAL